MRHRLVTILSALALLLCVAMVLLWGADQGIEVQWASALSMMG